MLSISLQILNKPVINILNDYLIYYPTPLNINYLWNFGLSGWYFLAVQVLASIFLAMRYKFYVDIVFLVLVVYTCYI